MLKPISIAILFGSLLAVPPLPANASGGSKQPKAASKSAVPPTRSPAEQAVDHYNFGLKSRNKAVRFEEKARQADKASRRAGYLKKAQVQYGKAIREFQLAVRLNPKFHQAFSSLGYAQRKSGDPGVAVITYDRALALSPNYTEAIEYRAEAFLGLDRLGEARKAYIRLFSTDRGRADELLRAMRKWIEARRGSPENLSKEEIDSFSGWVKDREEIASQTASLDGMKKRKW